MSKWSNRDEWESLKSGASCPICLQGEPTNIVANLDACFLTAREDAPMKGYCCLVLKRHAVEVYELPSPEADAFMRDLQKAAQAVQEITGAIKLNYEIHGNTIPHLHVHIFPRYPRDPFENQPINPRIVRQPVYAPGEFSEFIARLKASYGAAMTS